MNNFNRDLISFLSTLIQDIENNTISEQDYNKLLQLYLDKNELPYDNDMKYFVMGYYVYSILNK